VKIQLTELIKNWAADSFDFIDQKWEVIVLTFVGNEKWKVLLFCLIFDSRNCLLDPSEELLEYCGQSWCLIQLFLRYSSHEGDKELRAFVSVAEGREVFLTQVGCLPFSEGEVFCV